MMTTISHGLEAAKLPSWLMGHKLIRTVLAEREKEVEAQRQNQAKQLILARQERDRLFVEQQKDMAAAKAEADKIEAERKKLMDTHHESLTKLRQDYAATEANISTLETSLRESCDPVIGETISFFSDKLRELRHPRTLKRGTRKGSKNPGNFKQEVVRSSNQQAIDEAISYCRAAVDSLEKMKLLPKCDLARIEALRGGIPSVDEFVVAESYEHCAE